MRIHDRVENDIKCFRPALECLEGGRDLLCPSLTHLQHRIGTAQICHDSQPRETGDKLTQKFESLPGDISRLERHSGGVPARQRKACDKACANRIPCTRENYRDERCGLLNCKDRRSRISNDYIDFELDEIARDFSKP